MAAWMRYLALLGMVVVLAWVAARVTGWPLLPAAVLVASGVLAAGLAQVLGRGDAQWPRVLATLLQLLIGTAVLALMLVSLLWWLG